MNIAINPTVPEYRASIKLTPIEDMKVTNRYQHTESKWAGNVIVLVWFGIIIAAFMGVLPIT